MALNNFNFVGRLGGDAELRYTPSGKSVSAFSCAIDVGYGENKTTLWVRCNLWGKLGESVTQYLIKGTQVAVSGELSNREWEDKEGQTRTSLEVNVQQLQLIGGKSDGEKKAQRPTEHEKAKQDGYAPAPADRPKPSFDDLGDDIPFVSNICSVSDMIGLSKSLRRSRRGESVHCLFDKQAD